MENSCYCEQNASKVTYFTSQYGRNDSLSYTVVNICGDSSIYPKYGDFTQTSVMRTYGPWWNKCPSASKAFVNKGHNFYGEDFIELKFDEIVIPIQIKIFETYNPGSVIKIWGAKLKNSKSDEVQSWFLLWSGPIRSYNNNECHILKANCKQVQFYTNLIRLEMNHSELHYYNEIDCVRMLGIPLSFEEDEGSSVDREDDDVASLSKKYENINLFRNTEPQKQSFFESLPEEVIQLILLYLDTASLCNLASTCRLLHQHCYDRLLYKELDLQPYWPKIKDSSLESLTSRCRKLERINLSWCGGHNFISFNAFNKFLLNLETNLLVLRLSACEFLNDICFEAVCNNCPKLEELNIASCININEFSPLVRLNKLKKLNLYRTNIDYSSLDQFIMKCSSLEHLNVGSCSTLRNCDDIVAKLSSNCRNLKSLDFWRAKDVTSYSINSLAECKLLEELDIGWCKVESNCGCLRRLAENCHKVKKLFFTATRTVSDLDLQSIARYCPQLEQLDILGTREVTLRGIEVILDKCENLQLLDISFCEEIEKKTYLELQKQYPHVNIKKSFQGDNR